MTLNNTLRVGGPLVAVLGLLVGCGESVVGPERGSAAGQWTLQEGAGAPASSVSLSVTIVETKAGSLSGDGVFSQGTSGPLPIEISAGWNDNYNVFFRFIVDGREIDPRAFSGVLALDGRSIVGTLDDRSATLVR